jgi:hypothetical protein
VVAICIEVLSVLVIQFQTDGGGKHTEPVAEVNLCRLGGIAARHGSYDQEKTLGGQHGIDNIYWREKSKISLSEKSDDEPFPGRSLLFIGILCKSISVHRSAVGKHAI